MPHKQRHTGRAQQHTQPRTVIEALPGPVTYPPGGFATGAVGSGDLSTSALRQLTRVDEAGMLEALTMRSGALTSCDMSGQLFAQVVSVGISGNQVGIACFNMSGLVSGQQRLQELVSGVDLSKNVFKVMCQGF